LNTILSTTPDVPIKTLQWILSTHRVSDPELLQLPSVLREIGTEVPTQVSQGSQVSEEVIVTTETLSKIAWSSKAENLLKLYMERAQVYTILYGRAFRRMQLLGYCLSMPSIVLSTIAGTGNFALSSIDPESQGVATLVLGLLSSSTIVISSIESFFEITSQRDAFARAQSRYDSISRRIVAQLSLPRYMRTVDGASLLREVIKLDIAIQNEVPPLPNVALKSFVPLDTHHTPANVRIDPFLPILSSFEVAANEDAVQSNILAEQELEVRNAEIQSITEARNEEISRLQTDLKLALLERDQFQASLEKRKGAQVQKRWKK
jgi:hypothetical protein